MHGQFQLGVVVCMGSFSYEWLLTWSVSVIDATCMVSFSCGWLLVCMVSLGCEWLHAWSVSVGSATSMVSFSCEWLLACMVSFSCGCYLHGQFQL